MGSGLVAELTNFQRLIVYSGRTRKKLSYSSKGHAEQMEAWAAFLDGRANHRCRTSRRGPARSSPSPPSTRSEKGAPSTCLERTDDDGRRDRIGHGKSGACGSCFSAGASTMAVRSVRSCSWPSISTGPGSLPSCAPWTEPARCSTSTQPHPPARRQASGPVRPSALPQGGLDPAALEDRHRALLSVRRRDHRASHGPPRRSRRRHRLRAELGLSVDANQRTRLAGHATPGRSPDCKLVCREALREHPSRFPQDRVAVVHNGVDTERFRPRDRALARARLRLRDNQGLVGMFASFKEQKNHAMYFRVARRILDRRQALASSASGTHPRTTAPFASTRHRSGDYLSS